MATIELSVDGPHGPRAVRVANPDKLYFPERALTKADVVRYFLAVGDGILEALRDRPIMLERWPGGVDPATSRAVFQRRLPKGAPDWVETTRITYSDGSFADTVCPTETAVLAWAANLGTVTFHSWPMRRPDLEHLDRLQIDLDPQPGTGFQDVVHVATELRALLDELGIAGFPKTTGGRGLHVYVPIEPRWTYVEVRRALYGLGRELAGRLPRATTMERLKKDRGRRVYLDYNQIAGTTASPYSIRATPRATVSAPVTWEELARVRPEQFDVITMPARYAEAGDVHVGMAAKSFSLDPLLELAARYGEPPRQPRG